MMTTVAETLQRAARALHSHSESPRLDAELLLAKTLGLSRSGLISRANDAVAGERERSFCALIERRLAGAPVAYLTGTREFWSLALDVTQAAEWFECHWLRGTYDAATDRWDWR